MAKYDVNDAAVAKAHALIASVYRAGEWRHKTGRTGRP